MHLYSKSQMYSLSSISGKKIKQNYERVFTQKALMAPSKENAFTVPSPKSLFEIQNNVT